MKQRNTLSTKGGASMLCFAVYVCGALQIQEFATQEGEGFRHAMALTSIASDLTGCVEYFCFSMEVAGVRQGRRPSRAVSCSTTVIRV